MRPPQDRLAAFSAFAALALGAAGMVFERAGPSVLAAEPKVFADWARSHHRALLAQSSFLSASTVPMLVFFTGLRAALHLRGGRAAHGPVDLPLVVLGAGAAWVVLQVAAQATQVSMATAAARGATAGIVTSRGDLMVAILSVGNTTMATALAATAAVAFRDRALPRWLAWFSATAGVVHVVPLIGGHGRAGRRSADGAFDYLPYPVFVAWLVSIATHLMRNPPDAVPPSPPSRAASHEAVARRAAILDSL
jgi:hypothetical protein